MMYHLHESSGESAGTIYATHDQLVRLADLHTQVQVEIDHSIDRMRQALHIAREIGASELADLIVQYIVGQRALRILIDDAVLVAWPAAGSA